LIAGSPSVDENGVRSGVYADRSTRNKLNWLEAAEAGAEAPIAIPVSVISPIPRPYPATALPIPQPRKLFGGEKCFLEAGLRFYPAIMGIRLR